MRGLSWTGEWLQWGHRPRGSATSLGATVIALLVPSQRAWACFVRRAQRERIRPRIPNNNPTLRKKSGRWLTHMTQLPPALGCRSALLMSGRPTRSCSCWDRFSSDGFSPNLQARVLGQFGESNSWDAAAP
jgi:hypothetical protein